MKIDISRAAWRKSARSGGENCVEVAGNLPGAVGVRDSKDRQGPALIFNRREWSAFIEGVKKGKLEQ